MANPQTGDTTTGQAQSKARFNLPRSWGKSTENASDVIRRRPHRGDISGPSSYGNTLLRIAVIVLCSINAVMWEVYTESTTMALAWVAIVVGFIGWMIYDKTHH